MANREGTGRVVGTTTRSDGRGYGDAAQWQYAGPAPYGPSYGKQQQRHQRSSGWDAGTACKRGAGIRREQGRIAPGDTTQQQLVPRRGHPAAAQREQMATSQAHTSPMEAGRPLYRRKCEAAGCPYFHDFNTYVRVDFSNNCHMAGHRCALRPAPLGSSIM